ncbi:MAG: precorrin-2 C(20)-methyltransferase [Chloroflexota bacterium]
MTIGTLFGVGVGPGDPQLMTFKAASILQRAPVIAYVVDEKGDSFARQVAAVHIPASTLELPLRFSMSPQRERRLIARREAARRLLEHLSAGQDVAFITEGDPLLYSTFQHILLALPPEAPVEICPGVSSVFASAAAAHFPLALENQGMVIASASQARPEQIQAWLEQFEVIVLFKVFRSLGPLVEMLEQTGCLEGAMLVEKASLQDEVVIHDLSAWDGRQPAYFSLLLIRGKGTITSLE